MPMFLRQPSYFIIWISTIFLITAIIHPLGTTAVQADSVDKSVLDVFKEINGQAPVNDEEEKEKEVVNPIDLDQPLEAGIEEVSLFGMFFQLFLALAFIIVMIYGLLRFIGKRSQVYQANRTLQNIGGVQIGSNRSVQLVRVGERILVVGVGESIQLLKEIDEQNEVQKILADYDIQEGQGQQQISSLFKSFQSKLNRTNEIKTEKQHFSGLLERQLTDVKHAQKQAHAAIKEREQ